jgi:fucose 4-O-acetylase-like acetyltransferase
MTTAEAAAAPRAPGQKRRVPVWDNARFICVTLVVIGHGIQRLTADSDQALALYVFVYAFHMPAFAIISGYFSKASPPGSRQMLKVITDILLPYLIMQTIWSAVQFFVEGSTNPDPFTPHWTLWFLLALGLFRLLLPYLALLRWPLFWAVVASIVVGYLDSVDSTFSLSRALGILPFFVLGWQVRQWRLVERWRAMDAQAWWVRAAAVAVFVAWGAVVITFLDFWRTLDAHWFFYDDAYTALGTEQWWAGFYRLGFIALAVVLSAALLVLVPRRETWITGFGQATMYIYLLHSFVLYPLRETGVLEDHSSPWFLAAIVLACVAISIALAAPWVQRLFRPLIEPKPNWLFIDVGQKQSGRSRVDPTGSRRSE